MKYKREMKTVLILGFFDGIHAGHKKVIETAVNFAKNNNSKTVLLTFSKSPAEYFGHNTKYIYSREYNYSIIKYLGVDEIVETDFAALAQIEAETYLKDLIENYSPMAIVSGFNYTFGANKKGTTDYLKEKQTELDYKYFCVEPVTVNKNIVSSTLIKNLICSGNIAEANSLLNLGFSVESVVIKGNRVGRTIGFPTANIIYPENIVKLPYGVYKAEVLNRPAVLNWGIKPTLNGVNPIMETHIIGFNGDLYGKNIRITIKNKIRDEKKFDNIEDLKKQISKDIEECLKS